MNFVRIKKITYILFSVFLLLAFASCGSELSKNRLEGTWSTQTTILGITTETEYVFNEDGTGSMSGTFGIGLAMKYHIEENQLTIITDTPILQKTFVYTMAFDGDLLVLTDSSGNVIQLTKE